MEQLKGVKYVIGFPETVAQMFLEISYLTCTDMHACKLQVITYKYVIPEQSSVLTKLFAVG